MLSPCTSAAVGHEEQSARHAALTIDARKRPTAARTRNTNAVPLATDMVSRPAVVVKCVMAIQVGYWDVTKRRPLPAAPER